MIDPDDTFDLDLAERDHYDNVIRAEHLFGADDRVRAVARHRSMRKHPSNRHPDKGVS